MTKKNELFRKLSSLLLINLMLMPQVQAKSVVSSEDILVNSNQFDDQDGSDTLDEPKEKLTTRQKLMYGGIVVGAFALIAGGIYLAYDDARGYSNSFLLNPYGPDHMNWLNESTTINDEITIKRKQFTIGSITGDEYSGVSTDPNKDTSLEGKVFIVFGGRTGRNAARDLARVYTEGGARVVGIDYSGVGASKPRTSSWLGTSKITEQSLYLDAKTLVEYYINAKKIPPQNIIIVGSGLVGCADALQAGLDATQQKQDIGGLMLLFPRKNLESCLKQEGLLSSLSIKHFTEGQLDTEKKLKQLSEQRGDIPIAIAWGREPNDMEKPQIPTQFTNLVENTDSYDITLDNVARSISEKFVNLITKNK
ncbi:MAG: hypothetical protein NkDv07_0097 [Candidatus Improbicoccus devescovinae]|nr:MAG: hypothetical protein NkDv07_0097 [Candidatus Improbicoccus devescovinae]